MHFFNQLWKKARFLLGGGFKYFLFSPRKLGKMYFPPKGGRGKRDTSGMKKFEFKGHDGKC